MNVADVIKNRKVLAYAVLTTLAVLVLLLVTLVCWSGRFNVDELYGILD